jgi:hypothetical protein
MQIEFHSELTADQGAEWRAFQAATRHQHPRQDPRFAEVERATGKTALFVTGRCDGALCAVGLFSLLPSRLVAGRFSAASALSGPICDDAVTLIRFLRELAGAEAFAKVDAIKVTPYWLDSHAAILAEALAAEGWIRSDAEPVRFTGIIDLTLSEEALVASFSRSARRKVRLVEKSSIEIRSIATAQDAREFYDKLNELVLGPHGLSPVPRAEQEAMFAHVLTDPEIGAVWGAYHEGLFLGGLQVYRSQKTAHARRYVADPTAAKAVSNLRVAPSLWLEAMVWAKQQGCTNFDVEGYRLIEDKADPMFNVFEYKRELNPTEATRIAEHTLVLSKVFHLVNTFPRNVKYAIKERLPSLAKMIKTHPLLIRNTK